MKTLIVTLAYPPSVGAAASRAESLARSENVKVLSGPPFSPPKNNIDRLIIYTKFLLFYSWRLQRCDTIIFTSPYSLSFYSWPAIIYGKLIGAKVVLDNVDLWPEIITEVGGQKWAERLLWVMTKISCWGADKITFTFPSLIRRAAEFGVPIAKLELLPLIVTAKKCESEENGTVVYSGQLAKRYDFEILVRVARMLPKTRFIVRGMGEQAPYLKKMSASIENFEFWEGFLDKQDYQKFICSASICVCPLIDSKEAQTTVPTKVLEWLKMGKKVITTENPDIAETEAYTIKQGDAESMARIITELLNQIQNSDVVILP